MSDWIARRDKEAPENVVVDTKIDDEHGERNLQPMTRSGGLWFFPDRSMYVYYTPTHWRPRATTEPEETTRCDLCAGRLVEEWELVSGICDQCEDEETP